MARSRSKNASMNPCRMAFRLAKLTPSSTSRPSTWWNIGVCVASESMRYTRPGAMTASGRRSRAARSARICTGEVCVRSSARSPSTVLEIERVVHGARRMIGRHVQRGEIVEIVLDLRALGDLEARLRETGSRCAAARA